MEHSCVVGAVCSATAIIKGKFDYTRWQKEYFDGMPPEEISREAEMFERDNPYTGNAVQL